MDARSTQNLILYHFASCPYCSKVRRVISDHHLNILSRDILKNPSYGEELEKEGGIDQVPCLRIQNEDGTVRWMYESVDIIRYLKENFLT